MGTKKNRTNLIGGILMRPVSFSLKESEETWFGTKYSIDNKFRENYSDHLAALDIITECAKHYILNNYKKVTDWSSLHVIINDNSDEYTEYYNHIDRVCEPGSTSEKRNISRKKDHNPIKTLTDVVLDTSDGDFSLIINGKDHMWIDDTSVIVIADYIESIIN